MKKVAVIGLGIMGHGIAQNFQKNGYELIVWNRSEQNAENLISGGGKWANSPKEATESADLVFEVTANDESSRSVWLGDSGILAGADPSKTLVANATLSIDWVEELGEKCKAGGLSFFDMPMTGSRMGAESGQLVLFVGGDKDKLKDVLPELKSVAKEVKYFGPVGSGTKYKLVMNMVQAIHLAALGEALKLAGAVGLDIKQTGDALAEIPGGTTTDLAWKMYQNEPEKTNFSVQWIDKDLKYAKRMADTDHSLLEQVIKKFDAAIDQGLAEADWTKINKL